LITLLLAPRRGEMVADFCAGAGGKTLALGALMHNTGRLYAFDVAQKRLSNLRPRLARSGLSNVHPQLIVNEREQKLKRLIHKFDRVLVDAPCSGLGTLRRNPDLKWRQNEMDIAELAIKQTRILEAAARLVKFGGRLVYATCSLLREENEAVVEAFLANHPEFKALNAAEIFAQQKITLDSGSTLKLLPHVHGTDGFFAAAFERLPAAVLSVPVDEAELSEVVAEVEMMEAVAAKRSARAAKPKAVLKAKPLSKAEAVRKAKAVPKPKSAAKPKTANKPKTATKAAKKTQIY
jgi:16S rRNA (cytosine967-C5)-methyltransferase